MISKFTVLYVGVTELDSVLSQERRRARWSAGTKRPGEAQA
jgi:hypothetical protein